MTNTPEPDTDNLFNGIPIAIPFSTIMNEPNEKIQIYEGEFVVKGEQTEIPCTGTFKYEWYPTSGTNFSAQAFNVSKEQLLALRPNSEVIIVINGLIFGPAYITGITLSENPEFKGIMKHECVLGDKSILVNSIRFSVPNLKAFIGDAIRIENTSSVLNGRIHLETSQYDIKIDLPLAHKDRLNLLHSDGGYLIMYSGEISSKKGSISYQEAVEMLQCVSFYLSFINGYQVSAIFLVGLFEQEAIWRDYTNYITHQYLPIISWTDAHSFTDFQSLWISFRELWLSESGNDFLRKVIHWYIEANYSPTFAESKIMIAQAGLELVFNWLIIEQQQLLVNESITAANKLRQLLHQMKIDFGIPPGLSHITANTDYKTGPETFVIIRNSIVHQQEERRKNIDALPLMLRYQVLQLGIWYLELSILFVLDYRGLYCTRTSTRPHRETVPWALPKPPLT
jgi:hypothetical protein